MKKYFLLLFTLIFCAEMYAGVNLKKNKKKLKKQSIHLSDPFIKQSRAQKNESSIIYKAKKLKAPVGEVVGMTTYDLQTNSGVCRRVAQNPLGTFTYVGWTMDMDFTIEAPARGTGFNFYNRNTGKWGPIPTSRIEPTSRAGWPNIGFSQGRQFSITHTVSQGMLFTYRTGNQSDWTGYWPAI